MKLVEVVILVGTQCLSPVQSGPGLTEVSKVQCAVLVRQDPQTSDVEIVPRAAATNPDVIAMLVKPHGVSAEGEGVAQSTADAQDETGSISGPRPVPRSSDEMAKNVTKTVKVVEAAAAVTPKPRPVVKQETRHVAKAATLSRKRVVVGRRTDACGSYRAVWYTNKEGRRKYRCVKTG